MLHGGLVMGQVGPGFVQVIDPFSFPVDLNLVNSQARMLFACMSAMAA